MSVQIDGKQHVGATNACASNLPNADEEDLGPDMQQQLLIEKIKARQAAEAKEKNLAWLPPNLRDGIASVSSNLMVNTSHPTHRAMSPDPNESTPRVLGLSHMKSFHNSFKLQTEKFKEGFITTPTADKRLVSLGPQRIASPSASGQQISSQAQNPPMCNDPINREHSNGSTEKPDLSEHKNNDKERGDGEKNDNSSSPKQIISKSNHVSKPAEAAPVGQDHSSKPQSCDASNESEIVLSAICWKRRGGLGKHSTNAWEKRKIVLQGTKVIYFSDDSNDKDPESKCEELQDKTSHLKKSSAWLWEQAAEKALADIRAVTIGEIDSKEPRGVLDVLRDDGNVWCSRGHGGAPTPFCLSIRNSETKWKICFKTHHEQMEWMVKLSNLMVQHSIKKHEKENGDYSWKMIGSMTYTQNPKQPDIAGVDRLAKGGTSPATNTTINENTLENNTNNSEASKNVTNNSPDSEKKSQWALMGNNLFSVVFFANWGILFSNSFLGSLLMVVMVDFFTYLCIEKGRCELKQNIVISKGLSKKNGNCFHEKSINKRNGELRYELCGLKRPLPKHGDEHSVSTSSAVPVVEVRKTVAGSSTMKILKEDDVKTNKNGVKMNCWKNAPASVLQVRSFGYLTHRKKMASPSSLYECVAIDIVTSSKRIPFIGSKVELPKVNFSDDPGEKTWCSPDVFVVSVGIPTEAPKFTRSTVDGAGVNFSVYFTMREETRMILKRVTDPYYSDQPVNDESWSESVAEKVNGVRLFEEWCKRSADEPAFRGRFKLVPNALNLSDIGVPKLIDGYNSKPVLIKRADVTGFFYQQPGLVEFDINLHAFPYIAKQAFNYLSETYFCQILSNVGFVIEGRDDDELPEVVIGACYLSCPDLKLAPHANDFFANKHSAS
mmetsp:Transcript_25439/g.31288  ORF Transcript_25439/g.31288 Transcript_25439/m.31288 type:complete len:890 (+) Transcript_25439:116-2785(+)